MNGSRSSTLGFGLLALAVFLGLSVAGMSIGRGFAHSRKADRFVTVRGLAERDVPADLVVWPISFMVTGEELAAIDNDVGRRRATVVAFLYEHGFDSTQVSHGAPQITDTHVQMHYGERTGRGPRYIARTTVLLRSGDVAKAKAAMERAGDLVARGVVVAEEDWRATTEFLFLGLNDIKPAMIEEATRNAREAAQKFAVDAQSELGSIRTATQGLFSISDRDRNSPDIKTVRVVTTVQYFLAGK